jgi:DNA polymerase
MNLSDIGDLGRAVICPAPGNRYMIADYSGVESRGTGWLSGERAKVDAWNRFDETSDPKQEPYYLLGKKLGLPEETARKIGKTCDLAFGYGGSVPAFRALAGSAADKLSDDEIKKFRDFWRNQHPQTCRFWKWLINAAIRAVRNPNHTIPCGRVSFTCDGDFLRMRLPSGRDISYPQPRIETNSRGEPILLFKDSAKGFTDCRNGQGAWHGTFIENAVQGLARDILAETLLRLDAAGYPVVLHIHDEVVCEVPNGVGTLEEFAKLMTTLPAWADGLPIAIGKPRNCQRFAKTEDKNEALHTVEPIQARQSDTNSTPEPEIVQQNGQTPPSEELPPKPEPQKYLIKYTISAPMASRICRCGEISGQTKRESPKKILSNITLKRSG